MTGGKLGEHPAAATIAVKDAKAARDFYEGVVGLRVEEFDADKGVGMYVSGESRLVIYVSEFASTNKATSATWGVGDDLESIVAALKAKGVQFEHYPMPGTEIRGDIHVMGGSFRGVWFKDPDGNILHVNSG